MEAHALLSALHDTLRPLVEAEHGRLFVHDNEADAVACLMTGTDRWRLLLLADEEIIRDEPGEQYGGIADHHVRALVQHSEGPLFEKGASHFKPHASPHAAPLLERCTQVRLWFANMVFLRDSEPARDVDHATGTRYLGRSPYIPTPELLALRTWQLAFRIRAGLLMPDTDNEPRIPVQLS